MLIGVWHLQYAAAIRHFHIIDGDVLIGGDPEQLDFTSLGRAGEQYLAAAYPNGVQVVAVEVLSNALSLGIKGCGQNEREDQ